MSRGQLPAEPLTWDYFAHAAWSGAVGSASQWVKDNAHKINVYSSGRTALLWAISGGHLGISSLMLQHGGDLAKKTEAGDSALICAVWSGNAALVKFMIERGFSAAEEDAQGKTALELAEQGGHAEVIQVLKTCLKILSHERATARQEGMTARAKTYTVKARPKISTL